MVNNPGNKLKDYLQLSKLKIMIPVSLTGFTGYFIFDQHLSLNTGLVSIGILFLAISASVLNQIQEVEPDSRMVRTKNRPLPSGRINSKQALIYFFGNLLAGTILLYSYGNLTAALIGLITIAWYNGIYTYAKRVTAFAVVPGALTGASLRLSDGSQPGEGYGINLLYFLNFFSLSDRFRTSGY
jgi:protoheme IX farnesyltransferase